MDTTTPPTHLDLGHLYRAINAELTCRGLGDVAYSVDLSLWNHRFRDGAPSLGFRVWLGLPDGGRHGAWETLTPEATLAAVRQVLDEWEAARRVGADIPEGLVLTVALPGAVSADDALPPSLAEPVGLGVAAENDIPF